MIEIGFWFSRHIAVIEINFLKNKWIDIWLRVRKSKSAERMIFSKVWKKNDAVEAGLNLELKIFLLSPEALPFCVERRDGKRSLLKGIGRAWCTRNCWCLKKIENMKGKIINMYHIISNVWVTDTLVECPLLIIIIFMQSFNCNSYRYNFN